MVGQGVSPCDGSVIWPGPFTKKAASKASPVRPLLGAESSVWVPEEQMAGKGISLRQQGSFFVCLVPMLSTEGLKKRSTLL